MASTTGEMKTQAMKVLITGADGLLGSNLTRELLARGHSVRVFLHPESTSTTLGGLPLDVVRGDITDPEQVALACAGIEAVFHCAAITDMRADPKLSWSVNYEGTRHVLEACAEQNVRRLLFVGSASSFGFGPPECPGTEATPFSEEYRGQAYMESKFAAMELVRDTTARGEVDAVILAPMFMLGSHDSRPSSGELIQTFLTKGMRWLSPGGRNFAHVRDVARAIATALEKGRKGESYILGGKNYSFSEFFALVAKQAGTPAPKGVLPGALIRGAGKIGSGYERVSGARALLNDELARSACHSVAYSCEKAIAELDLQQTPIETAIDDSLECLRAFGHLPREASAASGGVPAGDFAGKTALISGASRGLGYATARELAKRGANIVITARGAERLEKSRKRLESEGANVAAVAGDIGNWDDAERMVNTAIERFGRLDILVNNAGVSMRGNFQELAPKTCADVLNTNLLGSVYLSRAAVEHIVKAKGNIVFISSIAGVFGLPGASIYCASKGAMSGLSESLRLELSPKGVHVGVVHVGFTEHDPEKRILSADGSLELPDRPAHHTQEEAGRLVVGMIKKRKRIETLTAVGKAGVLAYRISPRFVERAVLEAQSSKWRLFKSFS